MALRALRRETMRKLNYSLRDLYRTLEQPGDNPLRDGHARPRDCRMSKVALRSARSRTRDKISTAFHNPGRELLGIPCFR